MTCIVPAKMSRIAAKAFHPRPDRLGAVTVISRSSSFAGDLADRGA
jgi:hypothetical protein